MTQLLTEAPTFVARLERHRRELHVHCYRMLGSFDDASDAVEETFLRAEHQRQRLENGSWFRAWLYRIATNACLDAVGMSGRRAAAPLSPAGVPWLQPYPDRLLDETASCDGAPIVVAPETIELAYVCALQRLAPRQRAALILRDVVGWSMRETAGLLDASIVAADSALQRARASLPSQLPAHRPRRLASERQRDEQVVLACFIDEHERADGAGDWRLVPTAANRQPAAAGYLRRPGSPGYRPRTLFVLRVDDGAITEIVTFDAGLFQAFGLPATL
jgi:RNA polymerase sigma-70 factor (ECF subfamily)